MLLEQSRGVAKASLHLTGQAIAGQRLLAEGLQSETNEVDVASDARWRMRAMQQRCDRSSTCEKGLAGQRWNQQRLRAGRPWTNLT